MSREVSNSVVSAETERTIKQLESEGVILDFKTNPQIKHTSNPDSGGTTDHPGRGITRDNAVIYVDGKESRTKAIKYGNFNAIHEVLSQKLYALTGLASPHTKLMVGLDGVFADKLGSKMDAAHNKANNIPNLYVSSPVIQAYQDLGDFLLNGAQYFFDEDPIKKNKFNAERKEIIRLKSLPLPIDGERKKEILSHNFAIYELLPDYIHAEIEKSFAASKFIANWDFANFDLKNIGCKFVLKKDGKTPEKFESVFVDFGNSGVIGFGGEVKELSLERANQEAKPRNRTNHDFDPALALSADEMKFVGNASYEEMDVLLEKLSPQDRAGSPLVGLMSKAKSYETLDPAAQTQVKRFALRRIARISPASPEQKTVMQKLVHHIMAEEANHKITKTTGFLSFSDLPRNLPFGQLLKRSVDAKTAAVVAASDDVLLHHSNSHQVDEKTFHDALYKHKPWVDSEIEMAFRLSLIDDKAISAIFEKWNLCERFPKIFPFPEKVPEELRKNYSSAELAKVFIERKNHLVNSVPRQIVNQWVVENSHIAIAAEREVLLGGLKITNGTTKINVQNSAEARLLELQTHSPVIKKTSQITDDISVGMSTITVIKDKIEKRLIMGAEAIKESKDLVESDKIVKVLQGIVSSNVETGLQDVISSAKKFQKERELRAQQKNKEEVLERIKEKAEHWKRFNVGPNCNFFDIEILREIYREQHRIKPTKDNGKIRTSEENDALNKIRHEENVWVYDSFMESLEICGHAVHRSTQRPTAFQLQRQQQAQSLKS